ncbi:glutamate-1-semialdehyde 2,1-aminomutase [soil metagenome]
MTDAGDATAQPSRKLAFDRSREWYARARRTAPGGVHTNIRLSERPWPLFFESGHGGRLLDVDGNELVDLVCGNGPLILGHDPPEVLAAVHRQVDRGLVYAGQSTLEVEAAELICEHVPSAECVRFNMTGTEAIQAAIRIARAATGRQKLLLFQGHYDGWADSVLWNVATPSRPLGETGLIEPRPESLGVEARLAEDLFIAQWNDPAAVHDVLAAHGHEIAAVIMEPVMGNSAVVEPEPGYLQAVQEATRRAGALLIFDEVITGFRVAPGGAQGRYGIVPDLSVFGKAIGAGFPIACVAGRADIFEDVGSGRVLHAGTFNSNPVAAAAAVAALGILTDPGRGIHALLEERGSRLMAGLRRVSREAGLPILVQGLPMLTSISVTTADRIVDHAGAAAADHEALRRLQLHLVERGVRIAARGNLFLSAAHTEEDIDIVIEAFGDAAAEALAPSDATAAPVRA